MPYVLEEGIVVPTETSFMIVGEIVFSDAREQILEFHHVYMDWSLREQNHGSWNIWTIHHWGGQREILQHCQKNSFFLIYVRNQDRLR